MKRDRCSKETRLLCVVVAAVLILGTPGTATLAAESFADCGSGTTIELAVGKGLWQTNWGQGPWTWSDAAGESLLDPNVTGLLDLQTTAPADVSADMVATLPIAGTLTLTAHGQRDDNEVLGTMVFSGTGINVIDINASRVIVDEASGMFMAPFHPPAPKLSLTLDETTGVFAYIDQTQDCELHLAGSYAVPLIEGLGLQDNILTALGGKVPLIGGIGSFTLTGQYVADMSKAVQSFCEYGTGVALQIGAGGALWDQAWGSETWDWYECAAPVNAQFLGDGVIGQLETTTAGAPQIDANMVLSFDFGGQMTLNATSADNPDEIIGQIVGDVEGTFVADLNADHATFDDDGNIVVAFGWKPGYIPTFSRQGCGDGTLMVHSRPPSFRRCLCNRTSSPVLKTTRCCSAPKRSLS